MTNRLTTQEEIDGFQQKDVLDLIGTAVIAVSFLNTMLWVFGFLSWNKMMQIQGSILLFWFVVGCVTHFSKPKRYSSRNRDNTQPGVQYARPTSGTGHNQGFLIFWFLVLFAGYMGITLTLTRLVITEVINADYIGLNNFMNTLLRLTAILLNVWFGYIWVSNSFKFDAKPAHIYQLTLGGDMVGIGRNLRALTLFGICKLWPFSGTFEGNVLEYKEKIVNIIQLNSDSPDAKGQKEDGQIIDIKHKGEPKAVPRVAKFSLDFTLDDTSLYERTEGDIDSESCKTRIRKILLDTIESVLHEANCATVEEYEPMKAALSDKVFDRIIEPLRQIGLRPLRFKLETVEMTSKEAEEAVKGKGRITRAETNRTAEDIEAKGLDSVTKILLDAAGGDKDKALEIGSVLVGEVRGESTTIRQSGTRKKGTRNLADDAARAEVYESLRNDDGDDGDSDHHRHKHGGGDGK